MVKLVIFLIICTSCLKRLGPEQRVQNLYSDLMSLEGKEVISRNFAGDFEFESLELPLKDHKLKSIKTISEKKESETRLFLTTDLTFSKGRNLIEVRKIFELERIDGDWRIKGIENIKTYIESKTSIDIKKPL